MPESVNIRQICISNNFKEMCTYTENLVQTLLQKILSMSFCLAQET